MTTTPYAVQVATPEQARTAAAWAAREGWNPGLHDVDCYLAADADGFLVGQLGRQIYSTISAMRYGEDFGFIGFFIVDPAHRGRGYGLAVFRAAMERLRGRNVGLDGVVEQQSNYTKHGFHLAYRNIRFECNGSGDGSRDRSIVDLSGVPFDELAAYERPFFPVARPAFLKAWITQPQATALGVLRDGRLAGYAVWRQCVSGGKIGPLAADTEQDAEALFGALRASIAPTDVLYLDVPEVNPAAMTLARRHGMRMVFETARMYTGPQPDTPLRRQYGVTSFEIG
ncbi:GNAT family N-acetyltransferase [Tahibacter amnicola]|uniref:GNAT family N-acetyltransferase n=1 Tax=Tahibacter amnicola TaxID=2976241 RepID=A0ABY6BL23_9GAMM|nr:GNAT family N-acetyltransferase [Tahibacter amnicola]UXI70177.1 GNAT family N-acetyltransferase [Tahibacter amnicola]